MKQKHAIVAVMLLVSSFFMLTTPLWAKENKDKVIAIVLGKEITVADQDKLDKLIFGALLQQYAKEKNISPTDIELENFNTKMKAQEAKNLAEFTADKDRLLQELNSPTLSAAERKEKETQLHTLETLLRSEPEIGEMTSEMEAQIQAGYRQIAQQFVQSWKINQALFQQYGGRVIFQQGGPEPLDAYLAFLRDQESKGAFQILDPQYKAGFWDYFIRDSSHGFFDQDQGTELMNTPWWMMEKQPNN